MNGSADEGQRGRAKSLFSTILHVTIEVILLAFQRPLCRFLALFRFSIINPAFALPPFGSTLSNPFGFPFGFQTKHPVEMEAREAAYLSSS